MRHKTGILAVAALTVGVAISCTAGSPSIVPVDAPVAAPFAVAGATEDAPYLNQSAFKVAYHRITEGEYRNSIADIFGADIRINARFEPERREDGLQAIGNARLSITTSGLEQYFAVARSIADQVIDSEARDRLVGCAPGAGAAAEACARTFIRLRGKQLFRRPLTQGEIDEPLSIWRASFGQSADFGKSLKLSLVSLLMAPEFLFRIESAERDPAMPAGYRLDGYSKAARLSFILWNASPDAELLAAAQAGELHDAAGLRRQVERMTGSPRLLDGVRAFFADMLHFETFETLSKDGATYPKFSQAVADSAREETLKFLEQHLVTRASDYRDIFTTRESVINRPLAAIYNVPYPSKAAWADVTFPEDSERSGILTQVAFLSLFSHPGRSSPTIRGVKLYEIFMCIKTPDPPPDVDFSKVQATEKGTVRTRLIDHMTIPGCSSCHMLSDPAGLTLEHFDGLGQLRKLENNEVIDVSTQIGGKAFSGAQGLGRFLHDNPLVPECLVRNVHYYGVGRTPSTTDNAILRRQTAAFAEGGYKVVELYRSMLTDPDFFKLSVPAGVAPGRLNGQTSAQLQTLKGEIQ